jgi:glyoxylase I family protein
MKLNKIHHIAIIASDYEKSKKFYTEILGLEVLNEVYREERDSYMLDLALNGEYIIELFSFPNPPKRPSYPEASGLRHLGFAVDDVAVALKELQAKGVKTTELQIDTKTGKPMAFFFDPDELPLELCEA